MTSIAVVLGIVAALAVGTYAQYRLSRGRMWTPLWLAFSTTAAAILCLVSGIIGYQLGRHARFVAHTAWSPTAIWWEVYAGLGFAAAAAVLWRLALRSTQAPHRR